MTRNQKIRCLKVIGELEKTRGVYGGIKFKTKTGGKRHYAFDLRGTLSKANVPPHSGIGWHAFDAKSSQIRLRCFPPGAASKIDWKSIDLLKVEEIYHDRLLDDEQDSHRFTVKFKVS